MAFNRMTPDNSIWTPADKGYLAGSMLPDLAGTAQFHPGAGQLWLARCKLRASVASAQRTIGFNLSVLGAGLVNTYFGAYQFNGTNWVLLGQSPDQSAALMSPSATGFKTAIPGTFALLPSDVMVAFLVGTATTLPKLSGSGAGLQVINDNWPQPGLNTPVGRFMGGGAALTALPATLDTAGITWANSVSYYCRIT